MNTKYLFLIISIILIATGCSPKYLSVKPKNGELIYWERPDSLPVQKEIFINIEGLLLPKQKSNSFIVELLFGTITNSLTDYVYLDCGSLIKCIVIRYDYEPNLKSYNKILSDIYPDIKFVDGPSINLPKNSKTFKAYLNKTDELLLSATVAMVPHPEKGIIAIALDGFESMNPKYSKNIISSIAYDGIPASALVKLDADSINFIGRKFKKSPSCNWMGPRNLSCYSYGQMSWSIHPSINAAKLAADLEFKSSSLLYDVEILYDDTVKVIFEGVRTTARNVIMKMPFSKIFSLGASNTLHVYYVSAKVRKKYVHWIGSFYGDQAPVGRLAPLLKEVLRLD